MSDDLKPFNPIEDIEEFHRKFGLEYDGKPRALSTSLQSFRNKFLHEELAEYMGHTGMIARVLYEELSIEPDSASVTHHLEEMLDGLVDLVYVALGTSYLHGFDFAEAWRRVHAANMTKVRARVKSDSKRGSTHDVVKPQGWTAPSHTDLVENHAHRTPK